MTSHYRNKGNTWERINSITVGYSTIVAVKVTQSISKETPITREIDQEITVHKILGNVDSPHTNQSSVCIPYKSHGFLEQAVSCLGMIKETITLFESRLGGIRSLLHYLSVLSCKKSMGFVWDTNLAMVFVWNVIIISYFMDYYFLACFSINFGFLTLHFKQTQTLKQCSGDLSPLKQGYGFF